MPIHRVELRQMIGSKPNLEADPIHGYDYHLEEDIYSIQISLRNPGNYYFYTVSYDDAGNVSNFSKIITVTVSKEQAEPEEGK